MARRDFYTKNWAFSLGFTWGRTLPTIAGGNSGKVQIFLEHGALPVPRLRSGIFVVGDATNLYELPPGQRREVVMPPEDRHYDLPRTTRSADLNGYRLSFGHNIFNVGPPLKN